MTSGAGCTAAQHIVMRLRAAGALLHCAPAARAVTLPTAHGLAAMPRLRDQPTRCAASLRVAGCLLQRLLPVALAASSREMKWRK